MLQALNGCKPVKSFKIRETHDFGERFLPPAQSSGASLFFAAMTVVCCKKHNLPFANANKSRFGRDWR